jgi:hypothetical protein
VLTASLVSIANAAAISTLESESSLTSASIFKRRLPEELPQCATTADKKWQPCERRDDLKSNAEAKMLTLY